MVAAFTSTISSLLVNFRNGVGILTFVGIIILVHPGDEPRVSHSGSGVDQRRILGGEQWLELTQAGLNLARMAAMPIDGIKRLEAIARHAENDGILRRNL